MSANDLSGQVFGRWTVLKMTGRSGNKPTGQSLWHCRCECGREKQAVLYGALTTGGSRSCGCLRKEERAAKRTGRFENLDLYSVWQSMKTRCQNQRHASFRNYGARGIEICERWESFQNFLADVGKRPEGMTLERINNDGNYEPGNCRWASRLEQGRNKRTNQRVVWKGLDMTLTELARLENVAFHSLRNRIVQSEYTPEQAVNECRKLGLTYKERAPSLQ